MTGHFTSYETRTDHELATLGCIGVDSRTCFSMIPRKGHTAIVP